MDQSRLLLLLVSLLTSPVTASLRPRDSQPTANAVRSVHNRTKRSHPGSEAHMIQRLLLDYHRDEPPMPDLPTEVKLGVYIISFYSINEQTMDYQVSMYLRQQWHDPRLNFTSLGNKIVKMNLGAGDWNKLCIPDTFLRNEKGANFHRVTVENRMLELRKRGDLWYVIKISATLSCMMKLQKFPLDTQICPMLFESFGYTMDTMYFESLPLPVELASEELQLPQFRLVDWKVIDCSQNYTSGAYPCWAIHYELARDFGYYLIQVYVPTFLIVILSWVSFWINAESSPARVTIGLLTVLTTSTTSNSAQTSLPRVSYIKAIDVWMIVCLLFVFTSLIEYALVNVLVRRPARLAALASKNTDVKTVPTAQRSAEVSSDVARVTSFWSPATSATGSSHHRASSSSLRTTLRLTPSSSSTSSAGVTGSTDGVASGRPRSESSSNQAPAAAAAAAASARGSKLNASCLDKMSRLLFPTAFMVFNALYWGFYLYTSSTPLDEDQ